jgi:hypothetical protein
LEQQSTPASYSLSFSRAALCEILATKTFRKIYDENPESDETVGANLHAHLEIINNLASF